MRRRQHGRIVRFGALALGLVALLVAARGLERHNTWYLASDQYAFLTFAATTALFVATLAGLPSAHRAAAVQPLEAIKAE